MGRIIFPCGAEYQQKEKPVEAKIRKSDGAFRLLITDTDGGVTTPKIPGDPPSSPPCYACRKRGGGKTIRCFPSDEVAMAQQQKEGKQFHTGEIAWRFVTICYGRWEEEKAALKRKGK